jgi:hypothetical protein
MMLPMNYLIILLSLVLLSFLETTHAATPIAIHATAEERTIWLARRTAGPYTSDWTAILSNANAWRSSPDARWAGRTSNSCYVDTPGQPGRSHDAGMTDAGFVYLVTGDRTYRDVVRQQLLLQAAVAGTRFNNTTRWCPSNAFSNGYGEDVGPWLRRLTYAYSYIRSSLSSADRATLDAWFLAAANHFDTVVHNVIARRFPNRFSNNYSVCSQSSVCPGSDTGLTHFGGPRTFAFGRGWDNLQSSMNAVVGAVGALLGNPTLISHAKRFVQEWLQFGVYPGGQVSDQRRWNGATPQHGYLYPGTAIGSNIATVDHIARTGDTSLYTYSTSNGMFGTQGGPKTLLRVLQHFAGQTNGTVTEYASTSSTSNSALIIDESGSGGNRCEFVNITPANLFYKNTAIATAYRTTLPSSCASGGFDALGGEWGSYPRVRFMFGNMENESTVDPYP